MPQTPDDHVAYSLFDRLTDEEPKRKYDPPDPIWEQVQFFKRSVARDLTFLLNNRKSDADTPEEFEQTRESVAAYGVHDFTVAPMQPDEIRLAVERAIRIFEPRLSRVKVTIREAGILKFELRISASLKIGFRQELVVFDAELLKDVRLLSVIEGS